MELAVSCDASSTLFFLLLLLDITLPKGFLVKGSADDLTVAVQVSPFKRQVKSNLAMATGMFYPFWIDSNLNFEFKNK